MQVTRRNSVEFPNLFNFPTIKMTREQWSKSLWFFRILRKSDDMDLDFGTNNCTVVQTLVDGTKTFQDEEYGQEVVRTFLFMGDGQVQSFSEGDMFNVIPVRHLNECWKRVGEKSQLFKQIGFLTKKDLLDQGKIEFVD